MSRKSKTPKPDFEASLKALEEVVERLEDGDLPLETAVREWEKGVALRETCEKVLGEAERRVDKLMRKGEGFETEPLDESNDD